MPTSGPVEKIEGQQPECTNCINVDVAPPAFGASPEQIVEGYLRANSNFQPAYAVARQFLTKAAAERWSPEDGVQIYSGNTQASGSRVTLQRPAGRCRSVAIGATPRGTGDSRSTSA